MKLLIILLPIVLIIFFNKLFLFIIRGKKIVFLNYLISFIKFTIGVVLFFLIANYYLNLEFNYNYNFIISIIIFYFLLFICTFLIICTKFMSSPTEIIYNYLKKNHATSYNKLTNYIKKKNLIKIRFNDLKNQKLIFEKNNHIYLTKFGKNFTKNLNLLKKFFNVKCEG